ncbi:MAG: stage II sporulation protein D [Clostridiales bacterium]|nr:stage II sporulation protein D [Clostridiales bacterium]
MKQVFIKTAIVCVVVLLFPFILTLFLSNSTRNKNSIEAMNFKISHNIDNKIENVDFDTYIMGVVAANMPAGYHIEALKAQTVIARTYALYNIALLMEEGHADSHFTTSELGLAYIPISDMEQYWGSDDYKNHFAKIENAVHATKDEVLVYEGDLILPVFFETGSGYTRNANEAWGVDIPYLISVSSKQDVTSINYLKISEYYVKDLVDLLEKQYPDLRISEQNFFEQVTVIERDSTNYVTQMSINSKTIPGEEFARVLGLNSNHFYIEEYNGNVRIICTGVGHGVGLSQYGSNAMAQEGYPYFEILSHYYSGTSLMTLNED